VPGSRQPSLPAEYEPLALADAQTRDYVRTVAGFDRICASPGQLIEPGERAGVFRIGGGELLTDADGSSRITIERFTGADWHIVSYLGEEVLASQAPEVREFLLVTSVLNRMCAPLCDALTGRNDGAGLISDIYRANLFLIPLDDERRWFRYHHLFGGLLRHELTRTTPERPSVLH
jgi:hypothetical protein